jgi:hypothetical protein
VRYEKRVHAKRSLYKIDTALGLRKVPRTDSDKRTNSNFR